MYYIYAKCCCIFTAASQNLATSIAGTWGEKIDRIAFCPSWKALQQRKYVKARKAMVDFSKVNKLNINYQK